MIDWNNQKHDWAILVICFGILFRRLDLAESIYLHAVYLL